MRKYPKFSFNEIESPQSADLGLYDLEPLDEDDLWFLPGPDLDADTPEALPLPRADARPLVDVPAWIATGGGRAAIQRNLNWMTKAGIVREVTWEGRYRFWAAV